jgi:hypothetical protein
MLRRYLSVLALCLVGCGSALTFTASPKVPGASGTIDVAPGETGTSLKLAIAVHDLPPPSKASADANAYVVWVTPQMGGEPQRLGALSFDAALTGKLEAETAFHNFELFITPEESATPPTPLGAHVMTARVDR